MNSSDIADSERSGNRRVVQWLLAIVLLLGAAFSARADDCSALPNHTLDGFVPGTVAPSQISIDTNCTIRNFPGGLSTNFSFFTQPGQTDQRWVVIFDNVNWTGNMSCDAVHEHKIWLTNGSLSTLQPNCQNYLIPVEKIDKQIPSGQTTATIGVPFTYRLVIPVLFDPSGDGTGVIIDNQGSPNVLHGITVTDDLNATGADLTYVSHTAYMESNGAPVTHAFTNVGGLLTWEFAPLILPAGEQIVIELTVVLDDVPANALGTQFINTAKWDFGRLIDDQFFEPLPGEWGISPPLTIAAPNLVVDKTGPATMNLGETGQFTIDVLNAGLSDAWDITLLDRIPNGPTAGMCDTPPVISSVTLGGSPLTEGTHYSLNYATGPPSCELTLTLLDAAGPIQPNEHLIVSYQLELDANTQNGATLTNVAGATEWFNGDSTVVDRQPYTRTVTNGTVGTADHQDAHTVSVAITGFFFEKTVANVTTGASPTTTAAPGHTLRYTLRLVSADEPFTNVRIYDELDALNALPAFAPGTLTLVSYPPGADVSNTSSTGGAKGTGVIDIRNLNVPQGGVIQIQFDVTLAAAVAVGTVVTNQSALRLASNTTRALSDDPGVNGPADPDVAGDEDPTRVTIVPTALVFEKTVSNVTSGASPAAEARPGDRLRYRLRLLNQSNFALNGYSLRDEIDRLNAAAAFVPGTLTVVTVPAGANASNTTATGGAKGTGVLDVRGFTIAASGGTAVIEFEVTLAPVIANGTYVLNQSQLLMGGTVVALSDDPNLNGAADPMVAGDEDPTRIRIVSAPAFEVLKTSTDMTADPAVLLAGETLRYTITVRNIGNADATGVVLRDQIPANTTYVAGSTRLNGVTVADSGALSALVSGIAINAAGDPSGSLPADVPGLPDHIATITFDVVIDPTVVDGTIISNQGFVSALDSGIVDHPSDDPATPTLNDPTRDIVGNLPLLYAEKRVVLYGDQGSPGVVDPGDVLRYTITVQNSAAIPATAVVLRDAVPANTTYVADSTLLNGLPVRQPDGAVAPLVAGIDVSSSDLTPPLPGAGAGTISAGRTAVLQFDLRVNDGVPTGTLISNQAVVYSAELPNLLTDGDGNPATGPEPTVVVVGAGQQLSITKTVAVVGGGAALSGAQLEYVVTVTNIASVPAQYVVITDDLNATQTNYLSYVDQSATLNGSAAGVTFAGTTLTADYATQYGPLAPGAAVVLRFRALIAPNLATGTGLTNTGVVTWNDPPQTASASVSVDIGATPGAGALNGFAWHDADFDDVHDTTERYLEGWTVELYRDGALVYTTQTDASGAYRMSGVAPNYATGEAYELRFIAPGAVATTALLGRAASAFTNYLQRITDIIVPAGANLQDLNLPIDPNGVVYDSVTRVPIAGAVVRLLDARSSAELPTTCFDDPAQQNQVTLAGGYYKFDINFNDPACPSSGDYLIAVTPPGNGYMAGYSQMIPPVAGPANPPFAVPSCPGGASDAVVATAQYCEAQPSEYAPAVSVPGRSAGTSYYVHLVLDGSQLPGSSQIFNNHLPLDATFDGAIGISKTTPMLNVTRGQLVPYVITLTNQLGGVLPEVVVVDRYPAGFTYVEGSARLDDVPMEPTIVGRELHWSGVTIPGSRPRKLLLLLAVGAGVSEGEFVNRALVLNGLTGNAMSGEATATVRIVPDPTFDCTDVTGKVFDDVNRNKIQDAGEQGLAGVRVVTARGLAATTDAYGRYHITCAITPVEGRGSNFVLKLDDRTLPSGYRPSTQQSVVQRATRGKALKFNFGASIHRVVTLDVADAVFEPGTTQMRRQWQPRVSLLLRELQKSPAILRLSYLADVEDAGLVERRMQVLRKQITESWEALDCCYELTIEPEVFWRLGAPPEQSALRELPGR
jgi:uncharacterized repeat protein (TIGR01451 family)